MDKPTNPLDLEEIKGLMAKATPGPWGYGVRKDGSIWQSRGNPAAGAHYQDDFFGTEADIALIAAMHRQIPTLIEQYERMREALERIAADRHRVGFADHRRVSLERRDIARSALNQQEETNGLANG